MKLGIPSPLFHSLFTFDLQHYELTNNIMSDINSVSPEAANLPHLSCLSVQIHVGAC